MGLLIKCETYLIQKMLVKGCFLPPANECFKILNMTKF